MAALDRGVDAYLGSAVWLGIAGALAFGAGGRLQVIAGERVSRETAVFEGAWTTGGDPGKNQISGGAEA